MVGGKRGASHGWAPLKCVGVCWVLVAPCFAQPTPGVGDAAPVLAVARDSEAAYNQVLGKLLEASEGTHPLLKAARLQARASEQDVDVAQMQRGPVLSVVNESDTGTSASVPTRLLRVEQTLWDSGRGGSRVSEAQVRSQIAQLQTQLQRQDLLIQVINAWQGLVAAAERKRFAQEALVLLQGYREQMRRRVSLQASPRIDLELIEARVLQTEVELSGAQSSLQAAMTRLETLTSESTFGAPLEGLFKALDVTRTDSFVQLMQGFDGRGYALLNPVTQKARLEREWVAAQWNTKKSEQWPQVYARLDKPLAATAYSKVTNPSLFVGLRYTPGAGFSTSAEAQALATRIDGQEQAIEAATREVLQALQLDRDEFISSRIRVVALERSVQGAGEVLDSYLRQFQAGRKSWQDLLNSVRDLVQNQYALADSRATLLGSMHRLQLRMGRTLELP